MNYFLLELKRFVVALTQIEVFKVRSIASGETKAAKFLRDLKTLE